MISNKLLHLSVACSLFLFPTKKLACFFKKPEPQQKDCQTPKCPGKIQSIAEKVIKSVVSVETSVEITVRNGFRSEQRIQCSKGAGFVIDNGIIVTNAHVVQDVINNVNGVNSPSEYGNGKLEVRCYDGFCCKGEIMAFDMWSDFALIKVDEGRQWESVVFGDSDDISLGEWILTFGDPMGLGHSLSAGIISSLKRYDSDVEMEGKMDNRLEYIQVNFPGLDFGNSGGAVFNLKGEVIGVTCIKAVSGIGFATSSNTAQPLIDQLVEIGKVIRPWLGLRLVTLSQNTMNQLTDNPEHKSLSTLFNSCSKGVFILSVFNNSPASIAKLQVGDIITHINDKETDDTNDFFSKIGYSSDSLKLTVKRLESDKVKILNVIVDPEELDVFNNVKLPLNSVDQYEYDEYVKSLSPNQKDIFEFLGKK